MAIANGYSPAMIEQVCSMAVTLVHHEARDRFRLPGLRRYHGYALHRTILLRRADASDDLVTHELCHIWQSQHRALDSMLKHLTTRYRFNAYEIEARRAVAETASQVSDTVSDS